MSEFNRFFLYFLIRLSFSQAHKVGNVGVIANFIFLYISSFLLYLHQLMLVNVKLEIKGWMRITFHGYIYIYILLDKLILNGTAKMKLAMLAFLYCREFVKNFDEIAEFN